MPVVLRAAFILLGSMVVVPMLPAQPAALPPIFEPRPLTQNNRTVTPVAPAAISERTRSLISAATGRVLAEAKVFDAPVPLLSVPGETERTGDEPMMMERYTVRSRPLQSKERRLPDPPLLDFLKTGTFYRGTGKLERVGLNMMILKQPGLGWGKEFTRAQIEFIFRW